jgi:hypothetical protein
MQDTQAFATGQENFPVQVFLDDRQKTGCDGPPDAGSLLCGRQIDVQRRGEAAEQQQRQHNQTHGFRDDNYRAHISLLPQALRFAQSRAHFSCSPVPWAAKHSFLF